MSPLVFAKGADSLAEKAWSVIRENGFGGGVEQLGETKTLLTGKVMTETDSKEATNHFRINEKCRNVPLSETAKKSLSLIRARDMNISFSFER